MTSPTQQDASAFDINADFAALMKVLQLDPKEGLIELPQDPRQMASVRLA
jgi:hypothetical protein